MANEKDDKTPTFKLREFREHLEALRKIHDDAMASSDRPALVSYPDIRDRLQSLWALVAPPMTARSEDEAEPQVGVANDSALHVQGSRVVSEIFGGGAKTEAAIVRLCRDNHIKSRG